MNLEIKSPYDYSGSDRAEFCVKEISENGTFTGYASVFGKKDLHNEIVEAGAFSRSVTRASKDHRDGKFPLLWQHNQDEPIGSFSAVEDQRGLKITANLVMDVSRAKDAYALLKSKTINGLSIGYRVLKSEPDVDAKALKLKELDLWETSVVTFPANPWARVSQVKSVNSYGALPMAPADTAWDPRSARARVEGTKDAFLLCDPFRIQIADRIDGELSIVPAALFEATAIALGAKSDVRLSDDERDEALDVLSKYWRQLGQPAPWLKATNLQEIVKSISEILPYADSQVSEPLRKMFSGDTNQSDNTPFEWPAIFSEPEADDNEIAKLLGTMAKSISAHA